MLRIQVQDRATSFAVKEGGVSECLEVSVAPGEGATVVRSSASVCGWDGVGWMEGDLSIGRIEGCCKIYGQSTIRVSHHPISTSNPMHSS